MQNKRQWLMLGALGVVYGDIGTSPLYTVRAILHDSHEFGLTQANIYGACSLMFWALILVVSLKYVALIMRADHHGEGGILALLSLIESLVMKSRGRKALLLAIGIIGAALFYGDALITPAISVLSAAEGLEVAAPSISEFVVPISIVVLVALFAGQRFGTKRVGALFGPIMVVWFVTLGVLGIVHIVDEPGVLRAINPLYGFEFFRNNHLEGFLALGSVVLTVTGAEALYADMGHFGRSPIRRAWFFVVLPALFLNYFGQGALLLGHPEHIDNPFFHLVPSWGELPLVVLAGLATVIASQAVISGAFSLSRQAVRLGLLPLMDIRHTSDENEGQIYMPVVNWTLFAAVIAVVIGFGSSSALGSAYGLAVTGTFITSTIFVLAVARLIWRWPLWSVVVSGAVLLTVDVAFFSANVIKVVHGGWFPLLVALGIFLALSTWRRGQHVLRARRLEMEGSLQAFVDDLDRGAINLLRVPGTAVFLSANDTTTPLALRYNAERNGVLHEQVIVMTVDTADRPVVPDGDRITIDDLRVPHDGIVLVRASFGYSEVPDVPSALRLAVANGLQADVDHATYFLTRSSLRASNDGEMAPWRKRLFIAINRNAGNPTRYFNLPEERVVSMGSTISI